MAVAVLAAGVTVWTAPNASTERLVSASGGSDVRQAVVDLTAQRDQLAERVARLERGLGDLQLAARPVKTTEVTGSIGRPAAPAPTAPSAGPTAFAVSLGPDATIDAVRRRWTALAARYPQALSRLTPRALKPDGGTEVYDLVAGPFATRADADRACSTLADQGFACDTTIFAGEPLGRP